MLAELHIQNFAIIEDLHLSLGPGFNVLTGETGAGKSIIIEAVSLLLGERADQEVIRAGAQRAEIEAVFIPEPHVAAALAPLLTEHGLEGDDEELILAREVRRGGRSVGRVNGRAVSSQLLQEIGELLVDIHGQGRHLSLLRVREHVNLLDRYAGLEGLRADFAEQARALRRVRQELAELRRDERELARRMDLLTFQVNEIQAAQLREGEEEELKAERNRLANAEQLTRLTEEVCQALEEGTAEQSSALDLLGQAIQQLGRLERIDASLQPLRLEAERTAEALQELARSLRAYGDGIEYSPRRLAQVEERLGLIYSLKRKYGDSIAEVLAFGAAARQELDSITHAGERIEELETEEERLLRTLGRLGSELSSRRQEAAERLAAAVEAELADLRMARARFGVAITQVDDPTGAYVDGRRLAFDATGLDRVEFLVSANPGEPLRPLVKVASGGETSRLMLALKTVLSHADATPTLIFDEIDAGIGGRVGATVGQKLWRLTVPPEEAASWPRHQVLCVTHLPQLAAYGDVHIEVNKHVVGERTIATAEPIQGEARLQELTQMLGTDTDAGRQSVQEMLAEVAEAKSKLSTVPLTDYRRGS
ncbi:MAG: DNA repair protein RecN [Anaerolineae bacterium]|nr:DNA repair protein RecN [Anaerolineae bacterium]